MGVRAGVAAYWESTSSMVERTWVRMSLAAVGGRVMMVRPGCFSLRDMISCGVEKVGGREGF